MITHLDANAVRFEGDRPVAAGDEVVVVHPAGAMRGRPGDVRAELEGIAGDEARVGEEREAVGSLLLYLGGDDPGKAADVPRSQVEAGPPPTYWLSDDRNAPPASEPPSPAEQARRLEGPER